MASRLSHLFTEHPGSVGETYVEHLWVASRFGVRLLAAAGAAFVHAVFPWMFEKTAGNIILEMAEDMQNRRAGSARPATCTPSEKGAPNTHAGAVR